MLKSVNNKVKIIFKDNISEIHFLSIRKKYYSAELLTLVLLKLPSSVLYPVKMLLRKFDIITIPKIKKAKDVKSI